MKTTIKDFSLYLVTSQEYSPEKKTTDIVCSAASAGVDIVQLREKTKTAEEIKEIALHLLPLCRKNKTLLIINDDPLIARDIDADGVHLGQEDIRRFPVKLTRTLIGAEKIIGLSTHSLAQVEQANDEAVDYIAFGPVFPTKTKNYALGTRDVPEVLKRAKHPVVFIGGIDLANLELLMKLGAKNIAAIRSITQQDNIGGRIAEFKKVMLRYKKAAAVAAGGKK